MFGKNISKDWRQQLLTAKWRCSSIVPKEITMAKDITEKDITKAMKSFGNKVKARSAQNQDHVIRQLRAEMNRLRPQAARLLYGKP